MELVKILYKSCLYMDVDLSTAFFHVSDEPISDDPHVSACAMWEGCLASIAEVYTSDLAEGARESSDVQGPGAPELTRRFSLPSMTTEVQRVVPEAPAPAEPDSACPDKEELHRRASAQSRVHAEAAPGALAESLDDGVLLATFFRSRNTDITALVRGGKIPATVVALNLIFKCFYRPKRAGFRIFFGAMFCSIVVGVCTQPFLRMAVGKSPFGDLPREQAYPRVPCVGAVSRASSSICYFNICPDTLVLLQAQARAAATRHDSRPRAQLHVRRRPAAGLECRCSRRPRRGGVAPPGHAQLRGRGSVGGAAAGFTRR